MKHLLIPIIFFLLVSNIEAEVTSSIMAAMEAQKSIVTVVASESAGKRGVEEEGVAYKKGAGVLIDPSGIIVTNLHTLIHMDHLRVLSFDDKTARAQIIHLYPAHDLALLKINPNPSLRPIDFADCTKIHLGQEVINAGHSDWLKDTLSGGRIVGLGQNRATGALDVFEVNMDLYKGDSGGPVLNQKGQLLGIMTAKRNNKNKSSFAIPASKIQRLYLDYRRK